MSARIVESDGRLAFVNDTAYAVITHGNPDKVDMLLVLAVPPPGLVDEIAGSDWKAWVEVSVPVVWANLMPNEREHLLRVGYLQSTIEGCARPGSQRLEVDGHDIVVRLTPDAATAHALGHRLSRAGGGTRYRGAHRRVPRTWANLPGDSERPGNHYLYPASA